MRRTGKPVTQKEQIEKKVEACRIKSACLVGAGKVHDAEGVLLEALHIAEQGSSVECAGMQARRLVELAGLYVMQGRLDEARPLFVRSVKSMEESVSLSQPLTADPDPYGYQKVAAKRNQPTRSKQQDSDNADQHQADIDFLKALQFCNINLEKSAISFTENLQPTDKNSRTPTDSGLKHSRIAQTIVTSRAVDKARTRFKESIAGYWNANNG